MLESFFQTLTASLFVPGTAAGVLGGIVLTFYTFQKGWVSAGVFAEQNADLKASVARLEAQLEAAVKQIEELTKRLEPWINYEASIHDAIRADKLRGSAQDGH